MDKVSTELSELYGLQARLQVEIEMLELGLKLGDQPLLLTLFDEQDRPLKPNQFTTTKFSPVAVKSLIETLRSEVNSLGMRIDLLESHERRRRRTSGVIKIVRPSF